MNPSTRIDKEIATHPDWRGQTLAAIRRIIHDADPEVIEEWKSPVWSHQGIVCAADIHTNMVKMIFFKGASLPDPDGLFNAELGGNRRRAIKFLEGDRVKERALKRLVRAGVDLNCANVAKSNKTPKPRRTPVKARAKER